MDVNHQKFGCIIKLLEVVVFVFDVSQLGTILSLWQLDFKEQNVSGFTAQQLNFFESEKELCMNNCIAINKVFQDSCLIYKCFSI